MFDPVTPGMEGRQVNNMTDEKEKLYDWLILSRQDGQLVIGYQAEDAHKLYNA